MGEGRDTILFAHLGTWAAKEACERFLRDRGFSIGISQAGAPRGVLFGNFGISKWRNLRQADRDGLHATVTGDGREGPLRLTVLPACPSGARERLFTPTPAAEGGE